jgi:hypothetical protein
MNFVEQLTAMTLLVDFLLGMTMGMVGVVVYGSRLEDSRHSLLDRPPDALSAGARKILGVYAHTNRYGRRPLSDRGRRRGAEWGGKGTEPPR